MRRSGPGPILVVQHARREGLGLMRDVLDDHGLAVRFVRTFRGERVPRAAGRASAIIILGGPMGAYETDRFPHLADAIALASDALDRNVPILGVCLGSQILAAGAGARVYRGPAQDIGWFPVVLSDPGSRDPVLGSLPREAMVFHWHGDTFDLPRGATRLASSRLYENQAFRIGTRAYGVQFHPEITVEMVDAWVDAADRAGPGGGGREAADRLRSGARLYLPPLAHRVAAMLRGFLAAGALTRS